MAITAKELTDALFELAEREGGLVKSHVEKMFEGMLAQMPCKPKPKPSKPKPRFSVHEGGDGVKDFYPTEEDIPRYAAYVFDKNDRLRVARGDDEKEVARWANRKYYDGEAAYAYLNDRQENLIVHEWRPKT